MSAPRGAARLAAVALVCGLSGCLQGDYNLGRVHQPLAPADVDGLRPGVDSLSVVLARLGAPLFVRELGEGIALAYGWLDEENWNVEAQLPLGDTGGVQFTYGNTDQQLPGVVVFIDPSLMVRRIERGVLRDLLPTKARPMTLEGEATGG
ncbi:MAG: hypothetical protein R3F49_14650 [Planctomycetota bacterium]